MARTSQTSPRYVNSLPKSIEAYDEIKSEAVDPYIAMREGYISYRAAHVKNKRYAVTNFDAQEVIGGAPY
jgi:ABC-type transporter lipoprotein component MlaA